jgi:hypothetical protein
MKHAVLSMDVEDWYHLDYFERGRCNTSLSMLDGLDVFASFLDKNTLPASFFVVGELIQDNEARLLDLSSAGHDVGVHSWSHVRPMDQGLEVFRSDLTRSIKAMSDIFGEKEFGYRAPCFSMDRTRLDVVKEVGFAYDSSFIDFEGHPLYENIDLTGYKKVSDSVYVLDDFFEFEVSTVNILGRKFPVSGGGYLRILPWLLNRILIEKFIREELLYVLYIHPFELSNAPCPDLPLGTSRSTSFRFKSGRVSVERKLNYLVELLDSAGFQFTTFESLRRIPSTIGLNKSNH